MKIAGMGALELLIILLLICCLIAWIISISKLIEAYRKKTENDINVSTGILWFMGLFASPIVLGLYICALPSKQKSSKDDPAANLPSI